MSKVLAVINFIDKHGRPVDPGFGVDEGGSIDNSLPGGGRIDNSLPGVEGPVDPGFGFPLPPVIPGQGLPPVHGYPTPGPVPPTYPVDPGYGFPVRPSIWPKPPLGIWPPPQPVYPSLPIYPTDSIDNSLPGGSPGKPGGGTPGTPGHLPALPPGSVWPPLPPEVGGKILAFCWLVGIGYRWVVIDPSLKPGFPDGGAPSHPIAPGGERPDNSLPSGRPERPDNSLPPVEGRPDNSLPPSAQPKR